MRYYLLDECLKQSLPFYVWFYCWFLMILFCIVSCFILLIRCFFSSVFRCAISQKSVIFCLSFYRKYLFICHLFWNRSTVNLILFNKQMLCLLLWVIVISSGRGMYVRRIRRLYRSKRVCLCLCLCVIQFCSFIWVSLELWYKAKIAAT